jgi:dTDP-4-dehydrorhamnose 3,5-epimerase-like enzyme
MFFSKPGIVEVGHRHPYDHASLVASGSIQVQLYDDETKELLPPVVYMSPAMVMIEKDKAHQITSLESDTIVCCIHALRDETETIIDPSMIPVPSSLLAAQNIFSKETDKKLNPPAIRFDDLTPNRVPRMFDASKFF